jgi:co-chaperonin GroES (HSP10)
MKPLRDNIIVKRVAHERKTSSGLILQSNVGEPDKAEVIAIGPKVDEVSIGDLLLVNWNKAVKVQDEEYIIPITEVVLVYGE